MPLATLDPQTSLIVIDLQRGVVEASFFHPINAVIRRIRALLDVFRAKELPVVLVHVNVAGRNRARAAACRLRRGGPTPRRSWTSRHAT